MSYSKVYEYYQAQTVLPTHGHFASPEDLDRHARQRAELFTDKLQLPPRLFQGADLVEFGPDSGENALVFARWGARCTLVEPNTNAHPVIREYFGRFGLEPGLAGLEAASVEAVAARPLAGPVCDFVIAEGFIYTVKPARLWMDLFARMLRPGGFLVFYFLESAGCFFELFLKVIQARHRALTGLDALASARALFQAKWDSIPHIRTIESWTMDVLENPFIRLSCLNDTDDLCRGLEAAGLVQHAGWPPLKHGLDVHWHKVRLAPEEVADRRSRHLDHRRMGHFFGRALFPLAPVPRALFDGLVADADALIDRYEPGRAEALRAGLADLDAFLAPGRVHGDAGDLEEARAALASADRLLALMTAGDPAALAAFCATDGPFIRTWGLPTHYLAFRRPQD